MKRSAFTLIEVIIALSVIGVISIGLAAFVRDMRIQQRTMVRASGQLEGGSAVMDLLERGLATCVADGGAAGAGVAGTPDSLRLLFREVGTAQGSAMSDLAEINIRFVSGASSISLSSANPGTPAQPATEVICEQVEDLRLRYHDGREWKQAFDSVVQQRLPVAVEVAIWFAGDKKTSPVVVDEGEGLGAPPEEETPVIRRQPDRLRIISVHDARGEDAQ